jgi:hypothetical protein
MHGECGDDEDCGGDAGVVGCSQITQIIRTALAVRRRAQLPLPAHLQGDCTTEERLLNNQNRIVIHESN